MVGHGEGRHVAGRESLQFLWRGVLALVTVVVVASSCSTSGELSVVSSPATKTPVAAAEVVTPEITPTSVASDEVEAEQSEPPRGLPTRHDLWWVVEDTIALPRMSFELDVTSSLPGLTSPIVARRTGSFDDETFGGIGTRSFESDSAGLESTTELSFEFRLVGDVFWNKVTDGIDEDWGGFDLAEYSKLLGGDATGSVDGDVLLAAMVTAAEEVVEYTVWDDGVAEWVVLVRADELVNVVTAAGPASRLIDAGAGSSGIISEMNVLQSPEGYITAVSIDLDEWWTFALGLVDVGFETGDQTMRAEFLMYTFEDPLYPEAPCDDPVATLDDGLTLWKCL